MHIFNKSNIFSKMCFNDESFMIRFLFEQSNLECGHFSDAFSATVKKTCLQAICKAKINMTLKIMFRYMSLSK